MGEKVKLTVGIEKDRKEIEVEVADGDERPWGFDTRHVVVGTDVPRLDGPDKVTGRARYAYDVNLPGLCHAKVLRSPHAAAIVKSIDLSAAEAAPGVVAAVSVEAGARVRYHGEEVAALAAETEEAARDALRRIRVEYEPQPFVTDADEAQREGAPLVHADVPGNVLKGRGVRKSAEKLEEALGAGKAVVTALYRTQVQTHACLETHGCVARWDDEGLTVWASTQATGAWRSALARRYRLGDRVRILTHHMGGGFGSKFGPRRFEMWCVELARIAKRPVKLLRERKGEHLGTGNRPDSTQRFRGAATPDGKITALEIETFGTGGTQQGARCANPAFYDVPVVVKTERDVFTNAGPACAMRAPGWPQGIFALDSFVDELAASVGMDPLEFRRRNDPDPVRNEQYTVGAKEIGWELRKADGAGEGPLVRGFGMGNSQWFNAGGPGRGGGWRVDARIHRDGTVEMRNGAQDIGTGTRTLFAIAAAEELGLRPEAIRVSLGDTRDPPGPGSGGSQTAPSLFPAARNAAARARRALFDVVAPALETTPDSLVALAGAVTDRASGRRLSFAQACALLPEEGIAVTGRRFPNYPGYKNLVAGTQFAEVEVDLDTGVVRVVKVAAVQDCGLVINKLLAESQIIGAVIGGISYALYEERLLDRNLGGMVNPDLLFYRIAGAREMPEIVPIAHPVANGRNNAGMMGLGEPPAIPTAAAIANAVANATGARVRELPITPDKVLQALEAKRRGG